MKKIFIVVFVFLISACDIYETSYITPNVIKQIQSFCLKNDGIKRVNIEQYQKPSDRKYYQNRKYVCNDGAIFYQYEVLVDG